jgi:hypothetical protein
MLNNVLLIVRYGKCHYAECRGAVYAYHRSFIGPLQIKDSDDFVVGGGGRGVNVIKLFFFVADRRAK